MFAARNAMLTRPSGTAPPIITGIATSATTTITLPAHNSGDLIKLYAYRNSSTLPTKPGPSGTVPAWTDIVNPTGSTNSARAVYFVATANNHTSGTWTSAVRMVAVVISNAHPNFPIGSSASQAVSSASNVVAPALSPFDLTGASALFDFHGAVNVGTPGFTAAPSGYTQRAVTQTAASTGSVLNTKDVTTSDGAVTQAHSNASATANLGINVEVASATPGAIYPDSVNGASGADAATSTSWTHTTIAASSMLWVEFSSYGAVAPTTATCDGTAMTLVATIGNTRLYRVTVAAGAHTINFTYLSTMRWTACVSMAYTNVVTVGTPATTSGSSSGTITQGPITLTAGQVAIWAFGSFSGFTNSWSAPATGGNTRRIETNNGSVASIWRDANVTTTFSASYPTTADYQAVAVILSP